MLTLIRSIRESFGDPEIPKNGSAFKVLPLRAPRRKDLHAVYEDYLSTGGAPIQALESVVRARKTPKKE